MAEYIERGALIDDLSKTVVISCKTELVPHLQRVLNKFINRIKDQPTADVVEVVRCRDCKHHRKDETGCWCNRAFNSFRTVEDNFCKFGAKMDEECK